MIWRFHACIFRGLYGCTRALSRSTVGFLPRRPECDSRPTHGIFFVACVAFRTALQPASVTIQISSSVTL